MNTKNSESTSTFETNSDSSPLNSEESPEPSAEQRNKIRATKIARRARSFKDDFLGKIYQMKTPTNTISRSHSPKAKNTQSLHRDEGSKPSHDLNYHARQVKHALTHFKDVVNKNKLEMLHGNGTVVLETIANIHSALKAQKLNEHNSAIISAKQQAHQSLGDLIKMCDDALISDNEENFIALNKETVKEIIENLDNAVTNLVNLANEKSTEAATSPTKYPENEIEQRSSLPDIPLSNREKAELENSMMMQSSHSNESVLLQPPPKPSKDRRPSAPPLPPKKKTFSVDGMPDETDNSRQLQTRSEGLFGRKIDFNNFDDDGFGASDLSMNSFCTSVSSSTNERQFFATKAIEETELSQTMLKQFNQHNFSSIDSKECRINISADFNSSRVFQSMSSEVNDLDHSFGLLKINQSSYLTEGHAVSNESFSLMDTTNNEELPPPLPVKTRTRSLRLEHHKSVYDNVEDANRNSLDTRASTTSSNSSLTSSLSARTDNTNFNDFNHLMVKNKYKSCIESGSGSNFCVDQSSNENPPPLPRKKKHIMAYMEICSNASQATGMSHEESTLLRHSMHSFSQSTKMQSHSIGFQSTLMPKNSQFTPPALPPKKQRITSSNASINVTITPPVSPKISNDDVFLNNKNEEKQVQIREKSPTTSKSHGAVKNSAKPEEPGFETVVLRKKSTDKLKATNLMEELDVHDYLVFKKDGDNGPMILIGGLADALIIHATKVQKASEAFGEAFLLTFRTFINPFELIDKLISRYVFLNPQNHDQKKKSAKEAFSLLVRVVNDLTSPDLTAKLMEKLIQFVYDLVCSGELLMAKLLRGKIIEKTSLLRQKNLLGPHYLPSRPVMSNPPSLIDLKSTEIAEQMTILDAELFQKIEIPEVLVWAQEQCEERSPNLTLFTAHFNKLSYWARTQILKQQDARDREKHVMKFIKIMKHLRKINNFNSYLALLSALDSAPIRRLEWQKNITEGLKEYCALIDSSSSFRAYRQALSETTPPCIPYIGLVLQDLTFVHIGNSDFLPDLSDGYINFSKRWQQYNIVINMNRWRKDSYSFKKNDRIIGFFDNFDEYFDEDAMWQISEKIKPRGKKV